MFLNENLCLFYLQVGTEASVALFTVTCFTQISLPSVCIRRLAENPETNWKTLSDLPELEITHPGGKSHLQLRSCLQWHGHGHANLCSLLCSKHSGEHAVFFEYNSMGDHTRSCFCFLGRQGQNGTTQGEMVRIVHGRFLLDTVKFLDECREI